MGLTIINRDIPQTELRSMGFWRWFREPVRGGHDFQVYGSRVSHRFYKHFATLISQIVVKTISEERSHNLKTPVCAPKHHCT